MKIIGAINRQTIVIVGTMGLAAGTLGACSDVGKTVAELDRQLIGGPLAALGIKQQKKKTIEYQERSTLEVPLEASLPHPSYAPPQPEPEKRTLSKQELQAIIDEGKRLRAARESGDESAQTIAERNKRAMEAYRRMQQREALRDQQGNIVRRSLTEPPTHLREFSPDAPKSLSKGEEEKQGLFYRLFNKNR